MSPEDLARELKQGRIRPAYLFAGERELSKEKALAALAAAGRGAVRRFIGNETRAVDLLEAQRNLSLLDPVAVIVVRQAARLPKAEAEILADALPLEPEEAESDGTETGGGARREAPPGPPVVFWDVTLDRKTRLFRAVAAAGGGVDFRALNRPETRRWIEAEARSFGHRLGGGVAELLVEAIGTDQMKLRRALEVLSLAVGEGAAVSPADVATHVPAARAHAGWELQDAVSARDGARAVRLLRDALEEGQEPPLLVGALFAEVRRLLVARELPPKVDGRGAAQKLGVPDWKAQKIVANARRFSLSELRRAAHRLADLDVAVKRGRDAPALLEEWLLDLAGGRGPGTTAD